MQTGKIRLVGSGCSATFTGDGAARVRGGAHQVEDGTGHCRMCGEQQAPAIQRREAVYALALEIDDAVSAASFNLADTDEGQKTVEAACLAAIERFRAVVGS